MLKLHPSSANRWLNCPGSLILCEELPEELKQSSDSLAALRGTSMHSAAEECLKGVPLHEVIRKYSLDDEAREEVQFYVDTVLKWMPPEGNVFGIEEKVAYEWGDGIMSGVVDFYAFHDDHLRVVDFKTGSYEVEAEKNAQLLCYAMALLKKYEISVKKVLLTIVQRGKVRESLVSADQISSHKLKVHSVIDAVNEGYAELKAGSYCRWCPAVIVCGVAHNTAMEAAQKEFSSLNVEQISQVLYDVENILSPYIAAVRDAAKRIMAEHSIPGWILRPVRRRNWNQKCDPERIIRWLKKRNVKMPSIVRAMSPAQLEKVAGERLPDDFVEIVEISSSIHPNDGREFD